MLGGLFDSKEKKAIKAKLEALNRIPFINNGGCAIVAVGLVEYLKEVYKEDGAKIIYLFSNYDGAYDNINDGNDDSCGHAVVLIQGKCYDSTGIHTLKSRMANDGFEKSIEVTEKFVIKTINKCGWNPSFDREEGVPMITEALGLDKEVLSKVKLHSEHGEW